MLYNILLSRRFDNIHYNPLGLIKDTNFTITTLNIHAPLRIRVCIYNYYTLYS